MSPPACDPGPRPRPPLTPPARDPRPRPLPPPTPTPPTPATTGLTMRATNGGGGRSMPNTDRPPPRPPPHLEQPEPSQAYAPRQQPQAAGGRQSPCRSGQSDDGHSGDARAGGTQGQKRPGHHQPLHSLQSSASDAPAPDGGQTPTPCSGAVKRTDRHAPGGRSQTTTPGCKQAGESRCCL